MAICPVHGDSNPSLAIYADGAYCFACKATWSSQDLLAQYPVLQVRYQSRGCRKDAKPTYIPASLVETYHQWIFTRYGHRRAWYHERGLTDKTIKKLKLGHALQSFTIPVLDILGKVKQLRFRCDPAYLDCSMGPKYWGVSGANQPTIYLPVNLLGSRDVVFLCEGELDAARLYQENLPAVSITNGARAFGGGQMKRAFEQVRTVYVCYDQDEAGEEGAQEVQEILGPKAIRVSWDIRFGKDITELLQNISIFEFHKIVRKNGALHR